MQGRSNHGFYGASRAPAAGAGSVASAGWRGPLAVVRSEAQALYDAGLLSRCALLGLPRLLGPPAVDVRPVQQARGYTDRHIDGHCAAGVLGGGKLGLKGPLCRLWPVAAASPRLGALRVARGGGLVDRHRGAPDVRRARTVFGQARPDALLRIGAVDAVRAAVLRRH